MRSSSPLPRAGRANSAGDLRRLVAGRSENCFGAAADAALKPSGAAAQLEISAAFSARRWRATFLELVGGVEFWRLAEEMIELLIKRKRMLAGETFKRGDF